MTDQLENILQAKLNEALKPIEKRLSDLEQRFSLESQKYLTSFKDLNAELKLKYISFQNLETDFQELKSQIKEAQNIAAQVLIKTEETLNEKVKQEEKSQLSKIVLKEKDFKFEDTLSQIHQSNTTNADYYEFSEDQKIVYKTRTGHKYHRKGCGYLSQSSFPISLVQAEKEGLTGCRRCGY